MYTGYIYKWENKINGKVYIGQTMNRYGYKERWSQHRYQAEKGMHGNNHFHNAIRKYGVGKFKKTVLDTINMESKTKLKENLDKLEIEYIKTYDSFNNGYNSTIGGEFNMWNSGNCFDNAYIKEKWKSTYAENKILKSIQIKTTYRLPKTMNELTLLYEDMDIRFNKYRYEYAHRKHWRSKQRHKDIGKTLYDRNLNIYSLDYMGYECIDKEVECVECIDIDVDMFDNEVVKNAMLIPVDDRHMYGDAKFDMEYIDTLIENNFSKTQLDIVDMRRRGFTQQYIADALKIDRSTVSRQLDKMVKNIIDAYEKEYEEKYYYLNVVKGKYKKCSKCGEIKLLQKFNKNARRKDGHENYCRKCREIAQ